MWPLGLFFGLLVVFIPVLHILARGTTTPPNANSTARNYNLTLTAMRITYLDPGYFGPESFIQLDGPNEFTFTVNVLQNLPADVKVIHQSYEKTARNEYIRAFSARDHYCDDYNKEIKHVPMYKCFHLFDAGIKECPIKKGIYSVRKAKCTSADGPALVPGRFWRINTTWTSMKDDKLLMARDVELTLTPKKSLRAHNG